MLLGYVRVSTLDQKTSLVEQERVIRGMAMAQGVTQFDLQIFRDEDVSGGMALSRRPAGRDLFDTAKQGDTVVAAKLDRMFRDALDALFTYNSFKQRGIDLILFDMGLEPVTKDGMSKVFFTMLCAFAELERNKIAERMQLGKRIKREKGGHTGGIAGYGSSVVGTGREAMLVPHEKEREMLAVLEELKGFYLCDITREINARGYRTRLGKPFDNKTIWRILPADARVKAEKYFRKPSRFFSAARQEAERAAHQGRV